MSVGKTRHPEPRMAGEATPKPNPPSPILRWVWVLECGHNVLADDAPDPLEDRVYCPGCGFSCLVVDQFFYRDEDAT